MRRYPTFLFFSTTVGGVLSAAPSTVLLLEALVVPGYEDEDVRRLHLLLGEPGLDHMVQVRDAGRDSG